MDMTDDREIIISNNSGKTIYCFVAPEDNFEVIKDSAKLEKIESGQKKEYENRPRSWQSYFEKSNDRKLRLYVFAIGEFESNIHQQKFVFTLNELEKRNWEFDIQPDNLNHR